MTSDTPAPVQEDLLDELVWRGLLALSTDEDALRAAFAAGPVTSTSASTRPRRACTSATSSSC